MPLPSSTCKKLTERSPPIKCFWSKKIDHGVVAGDPNLHTCAIPLPDLQKNHRQLIWSGPIDHWPVHFQYKINWSNTSMIGQVYETDWFQFFWYSVISWNKRQINCEKHVQYNGGLGAKFFFWPNQLASEVEGQPQTWFLGCEETLRVGLALHLEFRTVLGWKE